MQVAEHASCGGRREWESMRDRQTSAEREKLKEGDGSASLLKHIWSIPVWLTHGEFRCLEYASLSVTDLKNISLSRRKIKCTTFLKRTKNYNIIYPFTMILEWFKTKKSGVFWSLQFVLLSIVYIYFLCDNGKPCISVRFTMYVFQNCKQNFSPKFIPDPNNLPQIF